MRVWSNEHFLVLISSDCGLCTAHSSNACTDRPSLTLSCVEGEVDRLLYTQCAVSEGSDIY